MYTRADTDVNSGTASLPGRVGQAGEGARS